MNAAERLAQDPSVARYVRGILKGIGDELSPEDVFTTKQLAMWAHQNGWLHAPYPTSADNVKRVVDILMNRWNGAK